MSFGSAEQKAREMSHGPADRPVGRKYLRWVRATSAPKDLFVEIMSWFPHLDKQTLLKIH